MSELEEKLNAMMSNPQIMQQIASMAQSLGIGQQEESRPEPAAAPQNLPDPRLLQLLSNAAGQTAVDSNQKALLNALMPYLHTNRVRKLERAMRAAKIAGTASQFLNSGGLQLLSGR